VIDLEAASSMRPLFHNNKRPRKRPRSCFPAAMKTGDNKVNDDDDDDIIEILSPAVANKSSKATIKIPTPLRFVQIHHRSYQSIPEEAFAAAAVGGHFDATTVSTSLEQCNDDDDGKAATGKPKIALLECNCCFVDYPFEEMVSCRSAGHLFCKTCLQKHTEQRVFGLGNLGVVKNGNNNGSANDNNHNNHNGTLNNDSSKALEILCMHSSGCTSGFHEWQLRKALSEKGTQKV
jgi:hypothetical protein